MEAVSNNQSQSTWTRSVSEYKYTPSHMVLFGNQLSDSLIDIVSTASTHSHQAGWKKWHA